MTEWNEALKTVATLIGGTGVGVLLKTWLAYRKTREQSIDERAWRLIDELQASLNSIQIRQDALISSYSEAQGRIMSLTSDLKIARRKVLALRKLLKIHGIQEVVVDAGSNEDSD